MVECDHDSVEAAVRIRPGLLMRLHIFDDDTRIATITDLGKGKIMIFARSSREWSDMKRLVDSNYKVKSTHPKFLRLVAERAQSFDFSTEFQV